MSRTAALLACIAMTAATAAAAPIVDVPDVGGYATFQDQATGRIWLDFNNFFDTSYNDMAAAVQLLGFTVASRADVEQLLNTLPLTGGEWSGYSAIMGRAPNRALIWGAFSSTTELNWAYSYDTGGAWNIDELTGGALDVPPNAGSPDADMNIWAFQEGTTSTPEPSSIALLGLGLLALAAFKVKR